MFKGQKKKELQSKQKRKERKEKPGQCVARRSVECATPRLVYV